MNRPTLPKQLSPDGIVSVPTTLTTLTTSLAQIKHLHVANTTGGAVTLLVTDWAGNALVPTKSIAANDTYSLMASDTDGYYLVGLKWQAGGAGLLAEYLIYHTGYPGPGVNYTVSVSDTATITDTGNQNFTLKVSLSESLTLTDTPTGVPVFGFAVSDTATTSETNSMLMNKYLGFVSETAHMSESLNLVIA